MKEKGRGIYNIYKKEKVVRSVPDSGWATSPQKKSRRLFPPQYHGTILGYEPYQQQYSLVVL